MIVGLGILALVSMGLYVSLIHLSRRVYELETYIRELKVKGVLR